MGLGCVSPQAQFNKHWLVVRPGPVAFEVSFFAWEGSVTDWNLSRQQQAVHSAEAWCLLSLFPQLGREHPLNFSEGDLECQPRPHSSDRPQQGREQLPRMIIGFLESPLQKETGLPIQPLVFQLGPSLQGINLCPTSTGLHLISSVISHMPWSSNKGRVPGSQKWGSEDKNIW